MYSKAEQLGKKKPKRTSINAKANRELLKLQVKMGITHCELCSTQAITNAHRHKRNWYKGKPDKLLWDKKQVIFICTEHHQKLDDRSKTTEEEKEKIFIKLRGK